jgi:ABC-type proline/glycine betaine transport system ATPase subunit
MKNKSKFKGFVKVFGKDKQTLLSEIKIGESLAMGCELNKDEIGLYIASLDVSASCGFRFDEWDNFVRGVNRANKNLKEIYK